MPPDTRVPSPSSYCYANRLGDRQTKDAAINKCPIALDRQKEPNSALHPRDASEDHLEQNKWMEPSVGLATDIRVRAPTQTPRGKPKDRRKRAKAKTRLSRTDVEPLT